ncbi:MAG: peptidase M20 [Dethiosulfovibrio peptidovorans]|nr:MAG: peptidase M20 [Dethiosulfovibrio peptidovorans]
MTSLAKRVSELALFNENYIIEIRERIHRYPELSFKEYETSRLIRDELNKMGIGYVNSPVENGVIAEIDSDKPGNFLMLRADMDALPIQEDVDVSYKSKIDGVMHACGHDIHVANLLAVGKILKELKGEWTGKVKLVFQPGEENGGGGREMIRNGLMDELPDACFAIHVLNKKLGVVVAGSKNLTAYSDAFYITVKGKTAHSSAPEDGVDAIGIAAQIISTLNTIVAKNINPLESSTLNVGKIVGGTAPNIIAGEVKMELMMRNKTQKARDIFAERIETICRETASMMGGECEIKRRYGYDSVYNDEGLTGFVVDTIMSNADELYKNLDISETNVNELILAGNQFSMKSEDFGFYSQNTPSTMIWVGVGEGPVMHNSRFHVDSENIIFITKLMTIVALEYLRTPLKNLIMAE